MYLLNLVHPKTVFPFSSHFVRPAMTIFFDSFVGNALVFHHFEISVFNCFCQRHFRYSLFAGFVLILLFVPDQNLTQTYAHISYTNIFSVYGAVLRMFPTLSNWWDHHTACIPGGVFLTLYAPLLQHA